MQQALAKLSLGRHFAQYRAPITLERSEPEPDGALVAGEVDDFANRNPDASAVRLVIEVADATLRLDRKLKLAIYSRAAIPENWIVNLVDHSIEVYRQPNSAAAQYDQHTTLLRGESITVRSGGHVLGTIAVADLLS